MRILLPIIAICIILNHYGYSRPLTTTAAGDSIWKNETADKPLKICVISDLNSAYGSVTYSDEVKTVIKRLAVIKPDIILCAGDMVAGQKASLSPPQITNMWAAFKQIILDPVQKLGIPFGFTVGNHDASPSYPDERALAKKFWAENISLTNLTFVDSTHFPFYYTYIKNNVFFISWDAAGAHIKSEVFNWMKTQLSGNAAKNSRLQILIGHLPLYAIVESKNKPGEVIAAADSTLAFFRNQGIDLYISGHQHAYYPAAKNGVRLLNAGAIGDGPRKLIGDDALPQKTYTIINVPARHNKKLTHKSFIPGTNSLIKIKSLPDSVSGFNGVTKREDL